jgi:hypothetical protein
LSQEACLLWTSPLLPFSRQWLWWLRLTHLAFGQYFPLIRLLVYFSPFPCMYGFVSLLQQLWVPLGSYLGPGPRPQGIYIDFSLTTPAHIQSPRKILAGGKIIIVSSLCELQPCTFFSWQAMYEPHPPKEIYCPRQKTFVSAAYLRNHTIAHFHSSVSPWLAAPIPTFLWLISKWQLNFGRPMSP